jgi:hypothetical protein
VEVLVKAMPNPPDTALDGSPFHYSVYNQTASLLWTCIKGSDTSAAEEAAMDAMSGISDSITSVTTMAGVQEVNKAGLMSMLLPGMQITASIIVINSVYSRQMYETSRMFSCFIYFEVPKWEKEPEKTKYLLVPSADEVAQGARRLERLTLAVDSVGWRYQRAGFTTIFLIDCYMQLFLLVLCWLLVLGGRKLSAKCKVNCMPKIYPFFHAIHELLTFYFAMGLVLELMYFEPSSALQLASLALAVAANLYLLAYTLYIYYGFMRYPLMEVGTKEYREMVLVFGTFVRNIRYEEYQVCV